MKNAYHAIVLAAGKGTRMNSSLVKIVHKVAGIPIINHVLETLHSLNLDSIQLVLGYQAEQVKQVLGDDRLLFVEQTEQLGTGHAVMQTEAFFRDKGSDNVIILAGDCPLISKETLKGLMAAHYEKSAACTVLTTILDDAARYGRIIRDSQGRLLGIREAKDCSMEQLKIPEINTGIYCVNSQCLFDALKKTDTQNQQGEYYLTDIIHILKEAGELVEGHCTQNSDEVLGVNTRADLALINKIVYQKNNAKFMDSGVTILDPSTTFIDATAQISPDTIIHPFVVISGNSIIEPQAVIGSHSVLVDVKVTFGNIVPPFSYLTKI